MKKLIAAVILGGGIAVIPTLAQAQTIHNSGNFNIVVRTESCGVGGGHFWTLTPGKSATGVKTFTIPYGAGNHYWKNSDNVVVGSRSVYSGKCWSAKVGYVDYVRIG